MNETVPHPTQDLRSTEPSRIVFPAPDVARGVWIFADGHTEPFTIDDWLNLLK